MSTDDQHYIVIHLVVTIVTSPLCTIVFMCLISGYFPQRHQQWLIICQINIYKYFKFRFFAQPVVVLVAALVMNRWAREKTVSGIDNAVAFAGYIFLLVRSSSCHGYQFVSMETVISVELEICVCD